MNDILAVTISDLKGDADEGASAWLRSQEVVEAWRTKLLDLKRDIEQQFVDRKADLSDFQQECYRKGESGKSEYFEAKAEYDDWRAGAVRWKKKIEKRIAEAKMLRRQEGGNWERIARALERIADALEGKTRP